MKASRIPTATLVEIRGGECAHGFWPPPAPPPSPLLCHCVTLSLPQGLHFLSVESKQTGTGTGLWEPNMARVGNLRLLVTGHQESTRRQTDDIHGLRFWSPFYHTKICTARTSPARFDTVDPASSSLHARCALAEALSNRARRSRLTPKGTETSRCAVGQDLAAFERGFLVSQPHIASRAAVCF